MKFKLLNIILILALSGCAASQKPQITKEKQSTPIITTTKNSSEQDFQWIKTVLGKFILPKNWFARSEARKGHYALFITKEEIKDGNQFQTGFSLNYNRHIQKKAGVSPSEYANAWVDRLANKEGKEVLQKPYMRIHSGTKVFGVVVKDERIVMYQFLIANDKRDSLFITLFESPVAEWEDAWKTGKVIMNNLKIDADILIDADRPS